MKTFKILSKICRATAAALFAGSVLICAIVNDEKELAFMAVVIGLLTSATVGVFMTACKNDAVKKIGHGFAIAAYTIGLAYALPNLEDSVGALFTLFAFVALVAYYLCLLVIVIMNRGIPDSIDPREDVRIIRVKEWKQILDEGIITEEEYEEKRSQILGIKSKEAKKDLSVQKKA